MSCYLPIARETEGMDSCLSQEQSTFNAMCILISTFVFEPNDVIIKIPTITKKNYQNIKIDKINESKSY